MKKEMPTIEKKELKEFRVIRQALIEFEFFVYAESSYDAEQIVDENTSLTEYGETFGVDITDKYYDNAGDVAYIDRFYSGNGWWNSNDMHIEEDGGIIEIFKFEEHDWDDDENVFSQGESLIQAYKEEHGLNEDE